MDKLAKRMRLAAELRRLMDEDEADAAVLVFAKRDGTRVNSLAIHVNRDDGQPVPAAEILRNAVTAE